MKDLEKSCADSATQNRKNYMHEAVTASYMKDPEKTCGLSRESYMKDLEKSRADSAAQNRKSYMKHEGTKFMRKTWRRVTKMKLAWLYPTKVRKQLQP